MRSHSALKCKPQCHFEPLDFSNRQLLRPIAASLLLPRIAEFERDLIRERTTAGREAAMQRGVRFGRPPKLNEDQRRLILRLLDEGKGVAELARSFKVHTATIYRLQN